MEKLKQQHLIVNSIKEELEKHKGKLFSKPDDYKCFVWFNVEIGKYLYNDEHQDFNTIQELIEEDVLQYKKLSIHQGLPMVKYVLNSDI